MFASLAHSQTSYLLYLDNVQAWYESPELVTLILEIRDHIRNYVEHNISTPFSSVLVTRETPKFLREQVFEFLGPSTQADLQAILSSRGFDIPADLLEQIHEITHGNPGHAIIMAHQSERDERLGEQTSCSEEKLAELVLQNQALENELAWQPYESLSPQEKLILQTIAIFVEPVSPDMLKFVLSEASIRNIKRHQRRLINKYLVKKVHPFSYDVTISALDRAFYLSEADPGDLVKLNQRAELYYGELKGKEELANYHRQEAMRHQSRNCEAATPKSS